MAGKIGAKQEKKLDDGTKEKVYDKLFQIRDRHFLWSQDLENFCYEHQLSRRAFVRRASASGMKFVIAFPLTRVHEKDLAGKATIVFCCRDCNSLYFENKHDLLERDDIEICGSCLRRKKSRSAERRLTNSRAQRIAQNRPDVKRKMSVSVRAAWARDYEARCESIRDSYLTNPAHRENISKASLRNWRDDEYARRIERSSRSKIGRYNDIFYQSLCELAFLLWCEENGRSVARFAGSIPYEFEGKIRSYRPDFVVDERLIVEVKHSLQHEADLGRVKIVESKYDSLKEFCRQNNLSARLVEISKDFPLQYRRAKEVHNGEITS